MGNQLLTARKLVEEGIRVVVAEHGHYDHHKDAEIHLSRLLPPFDQATSALHDDVMARGLNVVVVVVSEFGRTTRVNRDLGREHWPYSNSMLLFGQGIPRGEVLGAVRPNGEIFGQASALRADYLAETFLRMLGFERVNVRTGQIFPFLNALV